MFYPGGLADIGSLIMDALANEIKEQCGYRPSHLSEKNNHIRNQNEKKNRQARIQMYRARVVLNEINGKKLDIFDWKG